MSLYRHQRYWEPCRRGSFSSGSCYGGSGQRSGYYPSYGRSYHPQTYWGGYGRGSYSPMPSSYSPIHYGGYGYGRGCFPPQHYGGYGYGQRYGLGYGSRRGSICYDPFSYGSGSYYPRSRKFSCSSIDGPY